MTEREAAAASARPLPVVAHLPARHAVHCARLDPDAGPCDCGAQPEPLVRLSDARAALADRAPQAVRRPLTEEQIRTMRAEAKADPRCAEEHWFVLLVRAAEKYHGIVPLAPQDTPKEN